MNLSGWQRVLPCGCQPRAGVPYDVRPPRLSGLASIRLLPASSSSAKMANAPVTAGKGARLEDPAVYAKRAQDFDALADAFRTLRAQAAAGEPLTKEARFAASCAIARALGHVRAQREALAARDGATGDAPVQRGKAVWMPPAEPGGPPRWGIVDAPGAMPRLVNPPPGEWKHLPVQPPWLFFPWIPAGGTIVLAAQPPVGKP